jgi:transcription elongation factor Elf1
MSRTARFLTTVLTTGRCICCAQATLCVTGVETGYVACTACRLRGEVEAEQIMHLIDTGRGSVFRPRRADLLYDA